MQVRGWTEDDGGDQQQEEVEDLDPQAQEEAAAAPANAVRTAGDHTLSAQLITDAFNNWYLPFPELHPSVLVVLLALLS